MNTPESADVLQLLARQRPTFQLQSGSDALRSTESFFHEHGGVDTAQFERTSQALEDEGLRFLASQIPQTATTIEVGGGASTVVFASRSAHHYCVNPDLTANGMIVDFLTSNGLNPDRVTFIADSSDRALPPLDIGSVDVALIDGNHSFPFPIIDWHYLEPHIAVGGVLMVDNSSINAVRMLCDFLDHEATYRFRDQLSECRVYEKTAPLGLGWSGQGINQHDFVGYSKLNRPYVERRLKAVARRLLKR